MAQVKPETFEMPRRALWILVPPLIVMGAGAVIVGLFGYPLDHLAKAVVQDGHAEAAGRLRVLATWLLLAVACIASILYCGHAVRALAPATTRLLRRLYLGLAAAGIVLVASGALEGGQRLVDRRVICAAFDLLQAEAAPAGGRETLTAYGRRSWVADDQFACPSHNRLYRQLWWLNETQKYLIVLLIPALALGMLSCSALPAAPTEEDCRYQVRRLNTHLYLTAAGLVAGLLFLSALLHWPGFAFRDAGARSYAAHVDAYILYWGVTYSLFIASYYVPVGMIITKACRAAPARAGGLRKTADGADPGGDAAGLASELFGHLKTLAALFAPAIAGLLGGVIQL